MSDFKNSMSKRVSYLESTSAIPTPAIIYALWLEIYVRQGGKISIFNRSNYSQASYVFNDLNIPVKNPDLAYSNFSWTRWTPTVAGNLIPKNYGSYALELMILPDIVNQNFMPATNDRRAGWEYGHTQVKTLTRDEKGFLGLSAASNTEQISSYHDIEEIRKSFNFTSSDTLESFSSRMGLTSRFLLQSVKELS